MKIRFFILFLILNLTLDSYSQNLYEKFLYDADSLYSTGEYVNAYRLYIDLMDKEYYPNTNLDVLIGRTEKVRDCIDILKVQIEEYIEQTEKKMRQLETAVLDKVIAEQKNKWDRNNVEKKTWKSNTKVFDIKRHITDLDLANYGILQLPNKIKECKNLRTIDLRGNPDLNIEQVKFILNYCPYKPKIKFDTQHQSTANNKKADSIISKLILISDSIEAIKDEYIFYEFGSKNRVEGVLRDYNNGSYYSAFNECELLITSCKNKNELNLLKAFDNLMFEAVDLRIRQLELEKNKLLSIKLRTDSIIFERAIQISLPNAHNFSFLNIESISFKDFRLKEIHPFISECKNLKSINLIGNSFENWDIVFQTLKNLNELSNIYVSASCLEEIPRAYWKQITGLKLTQYGLRQIPKDIGNLTQLEWLDIGGGNYYGDKNHIENQINDLKNLKNLKYLSLRNCDIHNIENVQLPISLESLNLSKNELKEIPSELGQLVNLSTLDLSLNNIKKLNLEKNKLNQMDTLILSYNELKDFPMDICALKNLQYLEMHHNQITTLPREIGQLTMLQLLNLSDNPINIISKEIINLKNLKWLKLGYYKLTNKKKMEIQASLPNCEITFRNIFD